MATFNSYRVIVRRTETIGQAEDPDGELPTETLKRTQ